MTRREFASAAATAGAALLPGGPLAAATQDSATGRATGPSPEYYELRRYLLRRGPGQQLVDAYLRSAAVPAWQRAGAGPIGVFTVMIGAESPSMFVLIPHK